MVGAVGADQVGIVTIDPDGRTGTVIAEYSRERIVTIGQSIGVAENPVYIALFEDPEVVFNIADTEIDPRVDMLTRQTLRISGIRSLLVLGLRVGGRLIGSVGIGRYRPNQPFASDTIANAQTIVAQLSIAIENIRLFNATQQRADQLQRIAAFGQVVQGSLQLPTILDAMLTQTLELLPADRISITLYDQRIGQLRIVAQYDEGKRFVDAQRGPLLTMTGSFAGQVWERGELLVIHDTQSLQNVRRTQDLSVRSLLIAPVTARGQRLGTVNLGSLAPNIYNDADIAIFQQIITQFAVAIENGILFAETERKARNEALINEISIKFQGYNDVDVMINTLLESLGNAIDARRGRIRFNSADVPMQQDS